MNFHKREPYCGLCHLLYVVHGMDRKLIKNVYILLIQYSFLYKSIYLQNYKCIKIKGQQIHILEKPIFKGFHALFHSVQLSNFIGALASPKISLQTFIDESLFARLLLKSKHNLWSFSNEMKQVFELRDNNTSFYWSVYSARAS